MSLAIAGFTFWVLCDSAIKLAGRSQLPACEIVAFLGIFMAMFIGVFSSWRGNARQLWPKRPRRLLLRAALDLGNNLCVVIALRHLSLTLFYILVFTSPMVVAVLGRVYVNERLDGRRIGAILAGFLGVLIAVWPLRASGRADWLGFAACAVCVSCFSISVVWSRIISQSERAESVTFFSGLVTGGAGLVGMLASAAPLHGRVLAALVMAGLLCALGNLCVFAALRYAAAATVSQYHYTQLVSGAAVAYLIFRERPTGSMLAGAVLIIASGLYIAMLAARVRVEAPTQAA